MKILGIDDVNRAPVLGSIWICGYLVDEKELPKLKEMGVRDSKLLTKNQIKSYAQALRKYGVYEIYFISPMRISNSKETEGLNLNDLECEAYCKIAKRFDKADLVIIDNFDHSREKFIQRATKLGFSFDWSKWIIEHNADLKYLPVSAASIIAKNYGNIELEIAKTKYDFDFGSGNASDYRTRKFIAMHLTHNPHCSNGYEFIRWSWKTINNIKKEYNL